MFALSLLPRTTTRKKIKTNRKKLLKQPAFKENSQRTSPRTLRVWDLVCGRASLSPFFQSFYFFGTAVGEPLMGLFADRWVLESEGTKREDHKRYC
ncbi:hypothetical protein E2C01_031101 [Portunus trituberculatus]|uniref:Uncharacterized protein n=1 Tax=Portunus trituberculatus TaxID=210409 RepID=A0A5B7EZ71_PORTR|nr:hypothetical protein [Portunus trituberculatus]